MRVFTDISGSHYGRLHVLSVEKYEKGKDRYYFCKCECGKEKSIRGSSLRSGLTTSCGCYRNEQVSASTRLHGMNKNYTNKVWAQKRQICLNPTNSQYKNHGAIGIKMCKRWDNFSTFLADMGEAPSEKHRLVRLDKTKGFKPSNCRWVLKVA